MCLKCNCYVHDVLATPFPYSDFYYGFYNLQVPKRMLPELVVEFHRLIGGEFPSHEQMMFVAVRLIEEGLVRRMGISYHGTIERGKPLHMTMNWIRYYLRLLGPITQLHVDHSGNFKESQMAPLSPEVIERYQERGLLSKTELVVSECKTT
jgi:hypothetical protein